MVKVLKLDRSKFCDINLLGISFCLRLKGRRPGRCCLIARSVNTRSLFKTVCRLCFPTVMLKLNFSFFLKNFQFQLRFFFD